MKTYVVLKLCHGGNVEDFVKQLEEVQVDVRAAPIATWCARNLRMHLICTWMSLFVGLDGQKKKKNIKSQSHIFSTFLFQLVVCQNFMNSRVDCASAAVKHQVLSAFFLREKQ